MQPGFGGARPISLWEEKDPYVAGIYHNAPRRDCRSGADSPGSSSPTLGKIGRPELKRTVFWALGVPRLRASVAVAAVVARTQFNSDIVEGWVMLVAAAFVVGMIWFMSKTARTMRGSD